MWVTTAQPAEPEKPEINSRLPSQAAIYLFRVRVGYRSED